MRRYAPPVPRRWLLFACVAMLVSWISTPAAQQSPRPIVDPNVNMVRGITFPDGDPYLQRQNEPSIAVSTRNPCHLVAGANDYRSVDIPFDNTELPGGTNAQPNQSLAGDAWLGLFKSFDCGQKWQSTLLPGYPQDTSGLAPELAGYDAGADPTVRAGTNGLFYYSGMVFDRGAQGDSKIFVARLIDNNNKERGDPIQFIDVATIDTGTKGQFLDKPWLAVDVPRNSFGPGSTLAASGSGPTCTINGQVIPAGNVYMVWARFTGDSSDHSKLMFAKSSDCGKTWKTRPVSNNQSISQGGNIAIAPHDGTVYLTWREFATPDKPIRMWSAVSSDGGESFSNPRVISNNVPLFDQLKSSTTFRTNALPAIVADHENRVYVAWSQRGFGAAYVNDVLTPNSDARIVMSVSTDRGQTWGPPFAIDPATRRGHQVMPSLTFAAGKIQAIYYDAREDVSGVFKDYIDDKDVTKLRHTIDVRGAQAAPAAQPAFVTAGLESFEISRYRTWNVGGVSMEIGANPPNLAMYSAGTMPFMGDYIDVSGLPSFPIQTSAGQVWQPNIGPINLMGASASSVMANGFPTLPIFHATWTDNRDVRYVGAECQVPPDPAATGERNANIYTARLTPGLYVGSPGNTKPLGYRVDPVTQQPTSELIQRGFVVFAQNTTSELKFFQFDITNQPPGGRASFRQFDRPVNGTPSAPLTTMVVAVPKSSTMARTVYATSTDAAAQILVNVQEVTPILSTSADGGQSQGGLSSLQTTQSEGKTWVWVPANTGLRGSILLNPDRTNPKILDPDLDSEVPKIASDEVHDPSMFEAQFFRHAKNIGSRMLDVKNPDPENPDPENPDPENPDPENPDPENPDPENPDPENPDPENPDPENPDPENPDPENTGVLNTALSDADVTSSSITDINWRVHNSGNTTSAYRFGPSIARTKTGEKYQLIVTRRYMTLTIDPKTCKPIYKSQNQVLVNIQNFKPRTPDPENPDPENPDPENPDPENPDPENPDPENPDPENPDPENPDPENASFFLSPDETATVTLRVFTPDGEDPPDTEEEVAGKTAAQAANTGETEVTTAVSGPDLTLSEPTPTFMPAAVRPGATITVNWTLTNRGTAGATSPSGTIKNNIYFSTNPTLDRFDTKIGNTVTTPASLAAPFPHCPANAVPEDPTVCRRTFATPVTMPGVPGQYYVIITTDEDNDADEYNEQGDPLPENDNEVFEADELNNVVVVPVRVDAYQLTFIQQPSATTQDFTIAPPIVVAVTHPDGQAVAMADVPSVTLAIQNNPAPGGILAGTTVQPVVGGVATFGDLRIDRAAAGYMLAATAPLSTGAISAPFTIEADLPPVTANESYTISEDDTLAIAAPGVLSNDSDPATKGGAPDGYGLNSAVATAPANGTLDLGADGAFSYTPNAGYGGTDSFTYYARDGRPGNQTLATVTITVTSINDAPSFTAGPNQSVMEDSGPATVPNWATNISAGANEAAQSVDFIVTNDNTALFAAQPALTPGGTLTFTPAANANGVANVTVRIHDNGGTANGGVDTSVPQTFVISVVAVADVPVAAPDAYTITEDTVLGVDANGFGALQGLLFNDTDADAGTALTAEYLTTTASGTLLPHANGSFSYTPNANFFGSDSFTYRAVDPQNNASNTVTVTITVLARNDAPSFVKGADQTAPAGNVAQTVPGWATAISAGPANEASQAVDFIVTNDNNGLFAVQPAVSPNGTLSFTPKQNANGTATVTVRIHDNGGTANGGVDTSAPQTFAITVTSTVQNYVVTNTNDSGNGSLRAAIINANANASADVISFDIAGGGVRTITPLSPLPAIVFPVYINATTQPGYNGAPLIELNGSSAGAGANGFSINASNVTVRGFVINRFGQSGISIAGTGSVVAGNYIGTNAAGTAAAPNGLDGVIVSNAPNLIGGVSSGDRNVVSGNARHGISFFGTPANGNAVKGNYIGTDASGTAAVGNGQAGVWIENSFTTQVGGDAAGDGNVIAGNFGDGVHLYICPATSACPGQLVAGNRIGTNAAGTAAIGNRRDGIHVTNSPRNTIRGNLISGNGHVDEPLFGDGIAIQTALLVDDPLAELHFGDQTIVGNFIGTNAAGTGPIPNRRMGILLNAYTKARIGGPAAADRNVISFNGTAGVFIGWTMSPNNVVQGNYIGVTASGTQAAGNQGSGVIITNSSSFNLVAGNVIGANAGNGISISAQSNANTIQGNTIGLDASGTAPMGNNGAGIGVSGMNSVISFNRIAHNTGAGIVVGGGLDTTANRISQNQVFDNGGLGIDLAADGVSANDAGDGDAGPNRLQNYPILTAAFSNGVGTTIAGTLNSSPNTAFTLEVFSNASADPSGYGEGRLYVGSLNVTTDGSGIAQFAGGLPNIAAGQFITATAIDPSGNTSEFSQARVVAQNTAPTATNDSATVVGGSSATFYPASNDTDPDVAAPSVTGTYEALSGMHALMSAGDVAVVSSTGLGYFTGGDLSAATRGSIGILNIANASVIGTIAKPVQGVSTLTRVNQGTQIAYLRINQSLVAIDGRPASPTFNQVILTRNLGQVQSMAIDETRGRLYVAVGSSSPTSAIASSVSVLDVDPESPTFHTIVADVAIGSFVQGMAINRTTNRIYVGHGGISWIDGATLAVQSIPGTGPAAGIAVNETLNLVYAVANTNLLSIDGATNTVLATIALPALGATGAVDSRLAIHQGSGRVYVRLAEFPNPSRLVIVDGQTGSPQFNQILTTLALGREDGTTMLALDESINRLVATSKSDLKIHVIDTTTDAIVNTISWTQPMTRVTVDPVTHRALVTGPIGFIAVVRLDTGVLVDQATTGTELFGLAADPASHSAYVTQTDTRSRLRIVGQNGGFSEVNLPSFAGRAQQVVRNPNTNRVYVLNGGTNSDGTAEALPGYVHVIDGATNTPLTRVPVGPFPFGLAVNTVTNKIYVGNNNRSSAFPGGMTVIDGATNTAVQADISLIPQNSAVPGQIGVGRDIEPNTATGKVYFRILSGSPTQLGVLSPANVATAIAGFTQVNTIRVNPVLNRVYVGTTQSGANVIHVFDGATDQPVATVQAGWPTSFITTQSYLAIDANSGRLFAANFLDDTLAVIDGNTNAVIANVPVGDGPSTVAVNQALNRIYVGNAVSRTLTIVDGVTLRVVRTLPLPLAPVRIDVDESSPARLFILSTGLEAKLAIVTDPGTASPTLNTVTYGGSGALTTNPDGSLTYQPAPGFSGNESFTYTITDGSGGIAQGTFNITVAQPLAITPPTLPPSTVNAPYSQSLVASGGTGPYRWAVVGGTWPLGLTLDTVTGAIGGSTRGAGNYSFTVQVTDSAPSPQTATAAYTLSVGPPVVTTQFLPSGFVSEPYSKPLIVGGATGAVTWTINTNNNPLLGWLSLSADGTLSGTPTEPGQTPSFTVTATDSLNQSASRAYSLLVNAPLDVFPPREGVVLESQPSFSFIGGSGTRTIMKTAGELPPGLTLNASGSFTGTALRHGEYAFTVDIKDCQPGSNGLPTCNNQTTPQSVSKNIVMRVSARDQQGNSQPSPGIPFGGAGGRRFAQVFTVGAQGVLTAIGLNNISCPSVTPVTVEIQRLGLDGLPDGQTIADGVAVANYNAIVVTPAIGVAIDEKLAFIVSSPVACSMSNMTNTDAYNGGDGYVDAGAGWQPLFSTDARYDLPSFRTLIQPAMEVGYLRQGRSNSTATLLNDGKVALVGGALAEVYDPAANSTTLSAGAMITPRTGHTTTLLADGRLLITGGRAIGVGGARLATAEIFDPAAGTFIAAANSMSSAREFHRAVRLGDGRVLVTGGQNDAGTRLAAADLFDPATNTFSPAPNMAATREQHTMTLLANGQVLIAAGYVGGPSAETFDPATNTFTNTANNGNMVVHSRGQATATLLADGKVLIAGGQSGEVRSTAELYDPATNGFTATGAMLGPRYIHAAALLPDGSVLIAGGHDQQPTSSYILPLASLERYLPGSGTFTAAGAMETRRQQFSAVVLPNGNVVLGPGFSQSWMSGNTVEIYDASAALSLTPTTLADAPLGQPYAAVVLNASGGDGPYTVTHVSGVIPPGMSYDQNTRTLSGTPTLTGIFTMGFEATDTAGRRVVQSLTLRVGSVLTITSPYRLTDGALTASYSVQLTAVGTPPFSWSLAPASSMLPPGLTISSGGEIAGNPTATGYYNFAVRAVDGTGQQAIKTLSISIQQPLTITTTSLNNVDLFGGGPGCVGAQNGVGTRTWSITNGALPTGLTINQNNGCFSGSVTAVGEFTFTVQVTDSASPPQSASRPFTVNAWAADQGNGFWFNEPDLTFGGETNRRLGQRIISGVTGTLAAIRLNGISCPAGATVTASIQGLTPAGAPDGTTMVSGSATAPFGSIVFNGGGQLFAADAQFALLLEADQACALKPGPQDNYPGDAFVSTGGGNWQTLQAFNGRFDIPFTTLITPSAGLTYMSWWRGDHASTVLPLPNGKVLITGGGSSSAELFDPSDNSSTPLPAMTSSRSGHTATLLSDSRVLLTGGRLQDGTRLATAEIFDPDTNTFTATGAMSAAREGHTATRLNDGTVLIAGGMTNGGPNLHTAEIYDPNAGTFTAVGNMTQARQAHTATLLNDGRVLIGAGYPAGNSAELYLPGTQTFIATDGFMSEPRGQHTATLLADGKVLITGGNGANGSASSGAEIFDPAAGANGRGTFSNTASGMSVRRLDHTATLLGDGSVLIAGGYTDTTCCFPRPGVATLERYVPALNAFEGAGTMLASRYNHAASALADGRVLFSGTHGWSNLGGRSAEAYDLDTAPRFASTTAPRGESGQAYSLTLFPAGGSGAPYTAAIVSGSLPAGIVFNAATMTFSGTAAESGTFPLTVSLSDSSARTTYHTITLRFDTLVILTGALPTAYQGVEYLGAGFAGQGIGNITWTMTSGVLPAGLTFNSPEGTITGTPTTSCCYYWITVKATDAAGQTAYQTVAINVQAPLNITTLSLGDNTAGNTYGGCVSANNGTGARTWSLSGNVPPGLSINPNTGCFNAAHPANVIRHAGTFAFTVHVSDSSVPAQTDSQNYTIRLHAQDQWPGSGWAASPVSLPASRRVAQVYRAASAFPLSAVQLNNFTCDPGVQVTVNVWPVTGAPPRPDESGSPLATLSTTADVMGNLPWITGFASPVTMPQGARFALVLSFSGSCQGNYWPASDFYSYGDGWLDDGAGWTRAAAAIGRYEVPMQTLVMPPSSLPFLDSWRDSGTKLPDGRLVLFGGDKTAEIYHPATNAITNFGQTMPTYRNGATASLLSTGKILLVGGRYWDNTLQQDVQPATTDIYDPATGEFTAGPAVPTGRYGHTATKLASGKILIAGGWNIVNGIYTTLDSALLFEADGSAVTPLQMTGARVEHTATLLADQRVLILGGWTGEPWPPTVAEIYDPAAGPNGTFTPVNANMPWWPSQHTATLLPNGTVLVAGGAGPNYPELAPDSMIFDPAGPSFTNAAGMLVPRLDATAVTLADGRIAFLGGSSNWAKWTPTSFVEIYNPVTASFTGAGNLVVDRTSPIAATFTDGTEKLMIAGTGGSSTMSGRVVEIFDTTSTPVVITNVALPAGQSGQAYSAILVAAGGNPGYLFSQPWGQLPPGVQLSPEGEFSGTPTAPGLYSFVVRVTDSALASADREFTIVVDTLTITSPQTLPNAVNGVYYEYQFTLSGGAGPFTWSSSNLPGGASLTPAGLLFGTFNANGWVGGTITVTDASGQTALKNFNFQVVEPFSLAAGTPFLGIATEFYHYEVQPQGGAAPYSWAIDAGMLLPGLQLNQFGSIQGFPTRTGLFSVTVRGTDSGAQTATIAVNERVTAIDQRAPGGGFGNVVTINSSQSIAQTLTVRANAPLFAVRAPIDCASGTLTLRIRNVEPGGAPGAVVLASGSFANAPLDQKFPIFIPLFLRAGDRIAVEFSSDGNCGMQYASEPDNYGGGAAYADTGGGYALMPGVADFKVETLVDLPDLQFTPTFRGGAQVTLAASGDAQITGNSQQVSAYDPAARTLVDRPSAIAFRSEGTATALPNGKILLAGGFDGANVTGAAELYDPATNSSTPTSEPMDAPRKQHTATLLADGTVLIAGGISWDGVTFVQMAEIYDPATDLFSPAGNMVTVRSLHQATLLPSGKVLLTGGASNGLQTLYTDAELYTPAAGFAASGGTMTTRRFKHRDVALADGRVLITGGQNFDLYETVDGVEVYDEGCDCFTADGMLTLPRQLHTATLLTNGTVLIAGGVIVPDSEEAESSMEQIFVSPVPGGSSAVPVGRMDVARAGHEAVRLCPAGGCVFANHVLFAGGFTQDAAQHSVETFNPDDIQPMAQWGAGYFSQVQSAFATPNFTVVSGALPGGLALGAADGFITGAPTEVGQFTFTVRITDGPTRTEYKTLTLTVFP